MDIGGFVKKSLIEYPGKVSAVVFTRGCNMKCPFCHNPDLVRKTVDPLEEKEIFDYINRYRKWLDAVVISGGEPCLQNDLPLFCRKLKSLGLKVKLETNGTFPDVIELLIREKLVDFIQMDLKTRPVPDEYNRVCGTRVHFGRIARSADMIRNSGISHEFATTIVPGLHQDDDIEKIRTGFGITEQEHRVQDFRPDTVLDRDALEAIMVPGQPVQKKIKAPLK